MKTFPTLFSVGTKDKVKEWSISCNGSTIIINHGYKGFSKITEEIKIQEGKNIGKKNETSAEEQAYKMAKSKWERKIKTGYVENLEKIHEQPLKVMLATEYKKNKKAIKFPCALMYKLDGERCCYDGKDLWSRNFKKFNLPHILKELENNCPFQIDGELYTDEVDFYTLSGLLHKDTVEEKDLFKIKLIVFDMISSLSFKERYDQLTEWFSKNNFKYIELLPFSIGSDETDIEKFFQHSLGEGYEGCMIRNLEGPYECDKRSKNLQKLKPFCDEEYEIVGFKEGQGRESGAVVWICKNEQDKTFSVRPEGTLEDKRKFFENGKDYIGKFLNVRFQEKTPAGIPRFPVGKYIRI